MKKSITISILLLGLLLIKPNNVSAVEKWCWGLINNTTGVDKTLFCNYTSEASCSTAYTKIYDAAVKSGDAQKFTFFSCQLKEPAAYGTPEWNAEQLEENNTVVPPQVPTNNPGGTPPAYNPVNSNIDVTGGGIQHDVNGGGKSAPTSSGCPKIAKLSDLICEVTWLLNRALYFIFALAFLSFLYGVYKYVKKGGDEKARKEGANFMWYGIVSLAIMFSVWGLVNFVLNTFGLTAGVVPGSIQNVIQGK